MRMHPSKPSIGKTDLCASAIGIRITIEAAAGFGGSVRVGLTRRRFGFERKGLGVGFAGGPGGERSVEPACEGEPLIVAAIDKSDVLAARRANYPRETCSECPTGCAEPAGPLLESDLDDGGVDAEKCRPNLVRARAVAYADGGEDGITKSYGVGEAVLSGRSTESDFEWSRLAGTGGNAGIGSVGLEGDVEGAFRVPIAAADISAALWRVETERGSVVPADVGRGVDTVLVLRVRGVGGEENVVVRGRRQQAYAPWFPYG
ncbi:hypothetical protein B0H14DRAFT_2557540 [Mycena olivaceomarginata]|nr:hypothetical protein B0H14DRAFT_2557540 [Mycena olivaceomarginata]